MKKSPYHGEQHADVALCLTILMRLAGTGFLPGNGVAAQQSVHPSAAQVAAPVRAEKVYSVLAALVQLHLNDVFDDVVGV